MPETDAEQRCGGPAGTDGGDADASVGGCARPGRDDDAGLGLPPRCPARRPCCCGRPLPGICRSAADAPGTARLRHSGAGSLSASGGSSAGKAGRASEMARTLMPGVAAGNIRPAGRPRQPRLAAAPSPRHQMQPGTARQRAAPAAAHAEDVGARGPGGTRLRCRGPGHLPRGRPAHWHTGRVPAAPARPASRPSARRPGSFTPRLWVPLRRRYPAPRQRRIRYVPACEQVDLASAALAAASRGRVFLLRPRRRYPGPGGGSGPGRASPCPAKVTKMTAKVRDMMRGALREGVAAAGGGGRQR